MQEVRLWYLDDGKSGKHTAQPVDALRNTTSELMLEELIVATPALLEDGLQLIGRQLPTQNGPLDLVGIDRQGRLVVFELKRGTLTRDAVSQIIDYASDLAAMERDDLGRHIEDQSGKYGVPKIENFNDWYTENYGSESQLFLLPRMILVGLGVDARTKRMVQFLSDAGIEIELLTLHAFDHGGRKFVARQIEVTETPAKRNNARGAQSRQALDAVVTEKAQQLAVHDLYHEMRDFIAERLRIPTGGYSNKNGVTFYRRSWADDPSGPGRAYASLLLDSKRKGMVVLVLTYRALREGGQIVREFIDLEKAERTSHWLQHYEQYELPVKATDWLQIRERFGKVLDATAAGIDTAEEAAQST